MLIQYCSDLHLEFPANRKFLSEHPLKPTGEIILLAGDITLFTDIEKEKEFFDFLSDHFDHAYWVPGNHEYYRSDIQTRSGSFTENIRPNVTLVNNTALYYKDVHLVFSTLWSRADVTKEWMIKKSMADFHLIRKNGNKINLDDYNSLHEECLHFLTNELQTSRPKTIVVSHHLPTFTNYPEKYRHSEINSAFATELLPMIEQSKASYWISGHTHGVIPDFAIGKTILTSNQLGYIEHNEHCAFVSDKCIEI